MPQRSSSEFLENVKVGDKIVAYGSYNNATILTVTKLTNTQIVTKTRGGNEDRWRKRDGYKVGNTDRWHSSYIGELTKEIEEQLEHSRLANLICGVRLEKLKGIPNHKLYSAAYFLGLIDDEPVRQEADSDVRASGAAVP